jgi:hypothetical protein
MSSPYYRSTAIAAQISYTESYRMRLRHRLSRCSTTFKICSSQLALYYSTCSTLTTSVCNIAFNAGPLLHASPDDQKRQENHRVAKQEVVNRWNEFRRLEYMGDHY